MDHLEHSAHFEMIYVIINYGMGSKVLHKAKELGIRGGTVLLGKGTVRNSFLNFFSLYDERKEIVLLGADRKTADHAMQELSREFKLEKPNHGIVFSTNTFRIVGSKSYRDELMDEERGVKESMYQLIMTIVNRGNAEDVISAAREAGSKGGTILNGRGAGIHETTRLFNMEIEPEKEIVMILSKEEVTEAIVNSINEKLELEKPGNGIIFVQDVNKAYGITE
jgi:nitrogen regulatory protein PII